MKKVLFSILLMFALVINVNADEWKLESINLSEKYNLKYIAEKKDNYFIAVGEEYDCTKGKCDLYKLELNGAVAKLNDLFTYEDEELMETTLEIQNGSLVKKTCDSKKCSASTEITTDSNNKYYTYLDCSVETYSESGLGHICEIGYKEGEVTKYGIITTELEYIVEASSDYSPIEKDKDFEQNMTILKNKDNNYIVVSTNKKSEILLNSTIGIKNISYVKVANSTENINYYTFNIDDVPLKEGEVRPAVINYDQYFTKDENIEITEDDMAIFDISLILINDKPYFYTHIVNMVDGVSTKTTMYTKDSKVVFKEALLWDTFDDKYIYYVFDGRLYISDGDKVIFEKEWDDVSNVLGNEYFDESTNTYYFLNSFDKILPIGSDNEKFRMYSLKNVSNINPETPSVPAPETPEKPKYSCKEVDGKYYSEDGSVVDKKTYESVCGLNDNPHTGQAISALFIGGLFGLALFIKNRRKTNAINKI